MINEINIKHLRLFILVFLIVFVAALPLNVMDVDAAQYACISRDMVKSDNWLHVYDRGHDYLDKPPLLFWLASTSFKFFGVSNWAYKLPSFLFALLGIISTIKLCALLYDRKTGMLAGLMLASGLAMFIMTNDVRTDTILLGAVVFSIWQILLYLKTKNWICLIAGFVGIGAAMLAKGPLGIVIPAMALSAEFAYKRQWRNFIRPEWLIGLGIVSIILLPMAIGLYQQFDLHPEKMVNGKTGVSGLLFYFWTQSFGRVTGESDWGTKFDNDAGPFFFTHTFLWVFFPWSLLAAGALIKSILTLIKSRFRAGYLPELISAGGFVLIFLAMSASKYKLPHYIYVILPFAAILAARFLVHDVFHQAKRYLVITFTVLHGLFFVILSGVTLLILFFIFPDPPFSVIIATFLWILAGVFFAFRLWRKPEMLLYPLLCALLAFYFVGNLHFYPNLLSYSAPAAAGQIVAANKVPQGHYYTYKDLFAYTNDLYSGMTVP
ncbi:MAG TPA: glycosyltransferase family 39 protein, partial [Bacteroidia bacterium]|nr:glycosyltransferase family 39 protein [Bacteroidia bacterium]